MAKNALAAVAIGKTFAVNDNDIIEALDSFVPVNQRFTIIQTDWGRIINDAYNANPDSTKAAIDTFSKMAVKGRRLFVFGDMFELGNLTEVSHTEIGQIISDSSIDIVFNYGPMSKATHETVKRIGSVKTGHFLDKNELIDSIKMIIKPGDTVLIKGSRGNRLEDIIEGITN